MKIAFFDIETTAQKKIASLGAIDQQGNVIFPMGNNVEDFFNKTKDYEVLAGHNILYHDLEYLSRDAKISTSYLEKPIIDTLWLSSIIFIRKPYHKLLKEYKKVKENPEYEDFLDVFFLRHQPGGGANDMENNPLKDSLLSLNVFNNCVEEFKKIPNNIQQILYKLLGRTRQFFAFFEYLKEYNIFQDANIDVKYELHKILFPILNHDFFIKELDSLIENYPIELAYIFRLIEENINRDLSINSECSILPRRISYVLPDIDNVFFKIFKYKSYDLEKELKGRGMNSFRLYENEHGPIISQKDIVEAGFNHEDFIAILATGGGKSLCFQLPALSRAEASGFLTLVISPLQSLMEDQVANLKNRYHKMNVGALHSALDPLTRKEICEKVSEGGIDLLYLSPEMLRSPSTQTLLKKRHIDRLVIDESHCFSKWGHDFRIDYMFIADFIKELGKENPSVNDIAISCFTATAKQEVVHEIKAYFKDHFGKELKEFKSTTKRPNLNYEAYEILKDPTGLKSLDNIKFDKLINLLETEVNTQPCIIFTRYTGQNRIIGAQNLTQNINDRLKEDGRGEIKAAFFHGQLSGPEKRDMMQKFMTGEVNVIVATNAFGMGVDKTDVRFVIHYNMPNSLENYLQEAGRAGRDGESSRCIILYTQEDLDENLQLNESSKLKKEELQKLLKYIKKQFQIKGKNRIFKSAKEFIKYSGWISGDFEDTYSKNKQILETKLRTALRFLEKPEPDVKEPYFIERKFNKTRVFATAYMNGIKNDKIEYVYSCIDNLSNLSIEDRSTMKDIYREIRTGKAISIEDLPNRIGCNLKSTPERKGIEDLVLRLREEKLIDTDDEVSISLNVIKKQTSLSRIKQVRQFISALFDIILHENGGYINEGSEISFVTSSHHIGIVQYHSG